MLHFLRNAPPLDRIYMSIGMGTGVCALIAARDALGLQTRIVGVASTRAPAIALSFEKRQLTTHAASTRIADGVACSTPNDEALEHILRGVERIICVSDDETEAGMRAYFSDSQVHFVPPQDATALRNTIHYLANHPDMRLELARKAQARMGPSGLSSEAFVRRHVDISRELLALSPG